MKETVRGMIAVLCQSMTGDPEFDFINQFLSFSGQVMKVVMRKKGDFGP